MKKLLKYISGCLLLVLILSGCQQKNTESSSENNKQQVLKVGIEGTFPPFNYHDDKDKLTGYEVELAEAVGKKLDYKVEFIETKWDSLIAGLDVEKYDAVFNNISVTDEREKKYLFSNPYIYSQAILAVNKDSDIKTLKDFKGKKSAQTVSSNYATDAENLGAEVVPTEGFAQSIELLTGGRVDGTINDNVTFYYYQKEKEDNNIRLIEEEINTSEVAALINKNNKELQKKINKALGDLSQEGVTKELSIKYFGHDISQK